MRQQAVNAGDEFDGLLHRVVALNKLFAVAGEALARPAGQTLARMLVLREIEKEALSVSEIARRLGHKRQSVQRIADLLNDDGLLVYEDNPRHRRAKLARLRPAGRVVLDQIAETQRAWAQELGSRLGAEKLAVANAVLDEVLRSVTPPSSAAS